MLGLTCSSFALTAFRCRKEREAKKKEQQSAKVEQITTDTVDIDALVGDVPKLVQSAVAEAPKPAENFGSSASPGKAKLSTIESLTLDQRLQGLSVNAQICEIHIVSQTAETYTKGTQTDGNPDWNVIEPTAKSSTPRRASRAGSMSTLTDTAVDENADDPDAVDDENDDEEEEKVQIEQLSSDEVKKIMSGQTFNDFFQNTVRLTERAVIANTKYDVVTNYNETIASGVEDSGDKMSPAFDFVSERWCTGRSVTKLSWSPNNPELLLGCYSAAAGTGTADVDWSSKSDPDGLLLVWNVMNQAAPEYTFTAQSPVLTGMFHPFSPHLLLGSTYSGQICLWDIRARRSPIQKTQLSAAGHTHPVYAMQIVGTQNAHSIVTISTNGKLCQWDTTQLVTPTETLTLKMEGPSRTADQAAVDTAVAVTALAFGHGETNSFYVGAETGTLYDVEMHGSQPGVQQSYDAHFALVSSMQFHPQTDVRGSASDILLTSSFDWTLKLWNLKRGRDKANQPLHTFTASSDYIFDAKWSPIHPSLLVSGDASGNVDLWDLCKDMEVPIHRFTDGGQSGVTSLAWAASGERLATGFADGKITLLDINPHTAQPGSTAHSDFTELLSTLPVQDYSADPLEEDELKP